MNFLLFSVSEEEWWDDKQEQRVNYLQRIGKKSVLYLFTD